jgi:hypothetical protein
MRKLATILMTAFCALAVHTAAHAQADILLTGTITEQTTGQGISAKYEIVDASGNKTRGKSNSNGGVYQAVLKAGQDYTINISGFDILKKSETFSIPASAKYMEHNHNFKVTKLITGTHLYTLNAFAPKQASVLPSVNAELNELREVLQQNRLLKVVLTISANDSEFPKAKPAPAPKTQAKPKKGKKAEPVVEEPKVEAITPETSPEQDLMNKRIAALKEYFGDVRNAEDRIKYVCDAPGGTKAKTKSGAMANLVINVGEVKDLFE